MCQRGTPALAISVLGTLLIVPSARCVHAGSAGPKPAPHRSQVALDRGTRSVITLDGYPGAVAANRVQAPLHAKGSDRRPFPEQPAGAVWLGGIDSPERPTGS